MTPGDREYRTETLPLAPLFVTADVVERVRFVGCTLIGPGVVALLGTTKANECTWDAPGLDMFWVYPNDKEYLIGAMGFLDCEFFNCRFSRVGLAFPERSLDEMKQGFGLA